MLESNNPCSRNCEARHVGCHGTCPAYQAFAAGQAKKYAERLEKYRSTPPPTADKAANARKKARDQQRGRRVNPIT